ncbi:MAG: hypothetical protein LUG18_05125, partial [Candidatus Azobacteroides sp.]|nr:hypothetical protein [Candidatus Azobacteroides sp.]
YFRQRMILMQTYEGSTFDVVKGVGFLSNYLVILPWVNPSLFCSKRVLPFGEGKSGGVSE